MNEKDYKILIDADTTKWDRHRVRIEGQRPPDLRGADLHNVDLDEMNLTGIHLEDADLRGTLFTDCIMINAKLDGAIYDQYTQWPSPTMMLMVNWGDVSEKLCLDLMRFDAHNHPEPKKFIEWHLDEMQCPYACVCVERSANFRQSRRLIGYNFLRLRPKSAYKLMVALLREKCIYQKSND